MTRPIKALFIALLIVFSFFPGLPAGASGESDLSPGGIPIFPDFVKSVSDGAGDVVRGVYAPNVFALRVLQQRSGNYGYVSSMDDVVTQFAPARKYGVTGLLAHNYLAGSHFYDLQIGQEIRLIYGDGRVEYYEISAIYQYQALSPYSTDSYFIDQATGAGYTAAQVFDQFYTGSNHITFQTCIAKGDLLTWGRLFVIAYPKDTSALAARKN